MADEAEGVDEFVHGGLRSGPRRARPRRQQPLGEDEQPVGEQREQHREPAGGDQLGLEGPLAESAVWIGTPRPAS